MRVGWMDGPCAECISPLQRTIIRRELDQTITNDRANRFIPFRRNPERKDDYATS